MAQFIKLGCALFSCMGTVTGIALSTKESTKPLVLATSENFNGVPKEVKKGYWLLADWGDGKEWIVKSDKLSNPDNLNDQGLGFNDVEMYLGGKRIERGQKFTTQRDRKDYVLYSISGNSFLLENGKKLIPGELRDKWYSLGVTKYSGDPFKKWSKSTGAFDYDIEFDTCRFTKLVGRNIVNNSKIKVACQIISSYAWKKAWKELTEEDYK